MAFATFGAVAVGLILALLWWLNPSYHPDEPQPIPHLFPIIGHLIPFVRDRRKFFQWGQ